MKQQQFAFVPTYSALNITPDGSAALRATYSPGTSVGTPFINFRTAARENEDHLNYTALNSTWMLRELRQNPQVLSCTSFCQAQPTISGDGNVCSSVSYSIANLPANTTVRWEASPAGILDNSSSTGAVFTATTSGNNGQVTLLATLSSDCGEIAISRQIYVGAPETPIITLIDPLGLCNRVASYEITNFNSALTYTITGNGIAALPPHPTTRAFRMKGGAGSTGGSFTVTATTTCSSATLDDEVAFPSCTGSTTSSYTLSPNPASDEVLVQQAPDDSSASRQAAASQNTVPGISTVRVYDSYGRLRLTQPGHGNAAVRLLTAALPVGLYVVHIEQGGTVVSRQHLQLTR